MQNAPPFLGATITIKFNNCRVIELPAMDHTLHNMDCFQRHGFN